MDDRTYRRALSRAFGKAQKKINNICAKCFYPDCSLDAIESHSQQKLGQLRAIAENGEVYAMQRNHYQFQKKLPNSQFLVRTGISEASTFKGFCANHDKVVFSPIELMPLDSSNNEQAFALFIRAFSYEFAQKRRMLEWSNLLIDEVRGFIDRDMLEHFEGMRDGKAAFFRQDAPYYMNMIFSAIERKDYSQLTTVWKTVGKNLGISTCCVFSPLLDEHENHMKKTWGTPQPLTSFNLLPSTNVTQVVTSWLPNSAAYCGWVTRETDSKEGLERFINRCAFAESEDTCIRPSLWESLPEELRRKTEIAVAPDHVRGPLEVIPLVVTL